MVLLPEEQHGLLLTTHGHELVFARLIIQAKEITSADRTLCRHSSGCRAAPGRDEVHE